MTLPSCCTAISSWLRSLGKSANQNYKKLKDAYSVNTMLVFNSWLKDAEMCIKEHRLTNLEAVQLMKDYTTESARGTVEFYLDINSTWNYEELIEHPRTPFKSGEIFSSFVGDFTAEFSDHRKWKISLLMSFKF